MTRLEASNTTPERLSELTRNLSSTLFGKGNVRPCAESRLAELLEQSFGKKRATQVIDAMVLRRVSDRPFLEIEDAPAEKIAAVLKGESAAVTALVLAHLDPALSANVLGNFDSDHAVRIVRRMATLKPPSFTILRSICSDIADRLDDAVAEATGPGAGQRIKTIADMLTFSSSEIERSVLENLEEGSPEIVGEIREYMFTWEDIGTIDKRSMQKILGTVDTKTLSVALKACSAEVEANIMSNLSSRVAEMVREERELVGAVSMSDVLDAREEIMRGVRALIESGEFSPARAGEELVE